MRVYPSGRPRGAYSREFTPARGTVHRRYDVCEAGPCQGQPEGNHRVVEPGSYIDSPKPLDGCLPGKG